MKRSPKRAATELSRAARDRIDRIIEEAKKLLEESSPAPDIEPTPTKETLLELSVFWWRRAFSTSDENDAEKCMAAARRFSRELESLC